MSYFLVRRGIGFVLTLIAVSVVVFAVMNVLPGDPSLTILGIDSTEEARAALRERLGLDEPVVSRYLAWTFGALRGEFGTSYAFDVPVAELIAERLPMTLSLAISGMALTVVLALVQSAVLARVTRSSVLEVMRLDFVRTARASGLPRARVLWRHVLPNALVPIVTIVGLQFAGLVTGTIVIENVFYLPGLGRLLFQSIANRDLVTVQALVMLFAAIVVTANFLVDIAYLLIDPRLRGARA